MKNKIHFRETIAVDKKDLEELIVYVNETRYCSLLIKVERLLNKYLKNNDRIK